MGNTNVMSGMSCNRDAALRAAGREGRKEHLWDFNLGEKKERRQLPMGRGVQHVDIQTGLFVSVEHGQVVPCDPALGIAGLVEGVGVGNGGGYVVSVIVRAAIETRIEGIASDIRLGHKVYVHPDATRMTQIFTLADTGVHFGELLAITDWEGSRGLVGFKPASDARPFELARSSRGLEEKWMRG